MLGKMPGCKILPYTRTRRWRIQAGIYWPRIYRPSLFWLLILRLLWIRLFSLTVPAGSSKIRLLGRSGEKYGV